MKKILACFTLGLALSACNWHLRGSVDSAQHLSQLYVSAIDNRGALMTELRQILNANHATLTEDSFAANYSLRILEEKKEKRSAGVGGDSLSSAYEITMKAPYEIQLKNSNQTIKGTAISVRSFNYNTAAINSAAQEEAVLDTEMRRDLAQQMLRRLNAVIANPPVEKPKHKNNG
jgi:LPS-assembly lipoprotein